MTKEDKVFAILVKPKNDLDAVLGMVSIYCAAKSLKSGTKNLRRKLVSLLAYYVKYGYGKETKKIVVESLRITALNVNSMNTELTKKGYLINDKNNFHKKHLSEELQQLRALYMKGGDLKMVTTVFKNE